MKKYDSFSETLDMLKEILNGNQVAANLLAKVVHADDLEASAKRVSRFLSRQSDPDSPPPKDQSGQFFATGIDELNYDEEALSEMGIWIDPIDGTSHYINGEDVQPGGDLLKLNGLGVVTIILGLYNRKTGQVLGGVINRPFVNFNEEKGIWEGKIHFGECEGGLATQAQSRFASVVSIMEDGLWRNEDGECLTSNLQTLPQMRNRSKFKVEKRMGGIHDLNENKISYEEKEKKYLSLPVTELRSTDSGFSSPEKGLMRLTIGGSPVLNHSPSISPSMNGGGFDFSSYTSKPERSICVCFDILIKIFKTLRCDWLKKMNILIFAG